MGSIIIYIKLFSRTVQVMRHIVLCILPVHIRVQAMWCLVKKTLPVHHK